jgi:predicted negative regulator of RcsB-dependent stress response
VESYRTEEEQLEALKRWWKENGRSIMIGVVLALAVGFGWQGWQKNQRAATENASLIYQQMLLALSEEGSAAAERGRSLAEALRESHAGTTYSQFAALHLARMAVDAGELQEAEAELRGVAAEATVASDIQQVAQLRLARVLAAQGNIEQALALLGNAGEDFTASYAMARGDILLQEGRSAEAFTAYEEAQAGLDPSMPVPVSLEQKLQYLRALGAGFQQTLPELP